MDVVHHTGMNFCKCIRLQPYYTYALESWSLTNATTLSIGSQMATKRSVTEEMPPPPGVSRPLGVLLGRK